MLRIPKAEKVTHIKGRLLRRAVVCVHSLPFQRGSSIKGKNLLIENSFP